MFETMFGRNVLKQIYKQVLKTAKLKNNVWKCLKIKTS